MPLADFTLSPFLAYGLLLLAALVAGELGERVLRLPRATAYVLAGAAVPVLALDQRLGVSPLPLQALGEYCLGLVLFEVGRNLDLGWLRRNPWLLATALAEALLGLAAELVEPESGRRVALGEELAAMLERLAPRFTALDAEDALAHLRAALAEGTQADRLRAWAAETGGLEGVVRRQVEAWAAG